MKEYAWYRAKRLRLAAQNKQAHPDDRRYSKEPKDHTTRNEWDQLALLLSFEVAEQGFGPGEAAERAGMTWTVLHGLESQGRFLPSIHPRGFADGPRSGLWSPTDIRGLERYQSLRKAEVSKQSLDQVGANLCQHRPHLARKDGAYNDAFAQTKLIEKWGDVVEPDGDGFISWLHRPGEKLAEDPQTIAGFGERHFIPAEEKRVGDRDLSKRAFEQYVRSLRRHVFPILGPLKFSALRAGDIREFRSAKRKEVAEDTVDDYVGRLKSLLKHARRKRFFTGDLEALFESAPATGQPDEPARDLETVVSLARALEADPAFAIWYLLAAFLGLRPREISALKLRYVNYTETDRAIPALRLALRFKFLNGKVYDLSQREVRAGVRPLPRFLARMLQRLHETTNHTKGLDDFVFPNTTGKNAIDPKNVYRDHLNPAADKVRAGGNAVQRFDMWKLHRTAMMLADEAGIGVMQQDSVLRLQHKPEIIQPTNADFEDVRGKLDRLWARLHGTEVSEPAAKPPAVEQPAATEAAGAAADAGPGVIPVPPAAGKTRRDRTGEFCNLNNCRPADLWRSARVDKSDGFRWRNDSPKFPDESEVSKKIENVLSGKWSLYRGMEAARKAGLA
ncbi:MAG: hypothetical protein WD733_06505 [Bryobacterales bacterium]